MAAVSYLNTKPLTYGFEHGMMQDQVELVFDYPANVADMLLNNRADIGLVPVAILPRMKEYYLVSDFCIGASGPVASVCLFSDVPVNEIRRVLLDYQSRTSVALLKVLLSEHWGISPELVNTTAGFQHQIGGSTAGLVIGDRALIQQQKSTYVYDLAEAWLTMTGLPFVFAAWVANKQLPAAFLDQFNRATGEGLSHLEEIARSQVFEHADLYAYYTRNIDYIFDLQKRKGMELFHEKMRNTGMYIR